MTPTPGGVPADERDEPAPRDPGAQPERTWFAWRRTTLTFAVSVALAARVAVEQRTGTAVAAAAVGVLAWLGLLLTAHRRIGALSGARPSPMGAAQVMGTLVCVLVLVVVSGVLL
ncbi:DUF202 domain-containing protein [Streptomyces tubbatahanensis]|uniref:DUF202 domain-containing protein n=1 Tax=Streptomyces tubbatahanensis TaxID=2923272 RepID=A0ABY3XP12_9ACTN|nr:DUF202 domain-containing protein [Streptomyces tubbatahanensis]UNS96202.1 DUF202 domain-containing protein [Streptomyces tubbatahanensis]